MARRRIYKRDRKGRFARTGSSAKSRGTIKNNGVYLSEGHWVSTRKDDAPTIKRVIRSGNVERTALYAKAGVTLGGVAGTLAPGVGTGAGALAGGLAGALTGVVRGRQDMRTYKRAMKGRKI